MKFTYSITAMLCLSLSVLTAQEGIQQQGTLSAGDIPEAISDNHGFYFSGSQVDQWQLETLDNKTYYVAQFNQGEAAKVAIYTKGGERELYQEGVAISTIPTPVSVAVQNTYPDYQATAVQKITLFAPESTLYALSLTKDEEVQVVYVDALGKPVQRDILHAYLRK